jgi:hypothetical protein
VLFSMITFSPSSALLWSPLESIAPPDPVAVLLTNVLF